MHNYFWKATARSLGLRPKRRTARETQTIKEREQSMGVTGIKDRVAIVGMGCTTFGEHWDKSRRRLLIDAATRRLESAGVKPSDVDAFWLGTLGSGSLGLTLAARSRSTTSR